MVQIVLQDKKNAKLCVDEDIYCIQIEIPFTNGNA